MPKAQGRPTPENTISAEAIRRTARDQMRSRGSAGLTLRGIARALDVTAPAIYNYFPRLDDLITALVVDAFNGLGDAMIDAGEHVAEPETLARIQAMTRAFRTWAFEHPAEFQLIYGNPIPGYEAPAEVTVPLASRPFERLGRYFGEALAAGEIGIPAAYLEMPEPVRRHIIEQYEPLLLGAPPHILALLASSWARFHGIVVLEMFGHIGPVVGDVAAFYESELQAWSSMLVDAAPHGAGATRS